MLDGGNAAGTPWASMTVAEMRAVVHSASTDAQWGIAKGWTDSADLISAHRTQLEHFRDYLAAAWPPEQSAASEAYRNALNGMIDNIIQTHDAALTNHDALTQATGAIYQAQVRMDEIHQEYQNNQNLLDAFNAKKAQEEQLRNSGQPTPTPAPSGGEQPPVAPGRQEALRQEAVTLLSGVSTELAQAQVRIVTPPKYKLGFAIDEDSKAINDAPYQAPVIPPLVPVSSDDASVTRGSMPTTTFPSSSGTTTPVTTQPGITTPQPGLILGGTGPNAPGVTPPVVNSPAPTPPIVSPSSGPTILPPTPLPGGGPLALPPTGPSGGLPRETLIRGGGPASGGLRAMPPGGIIGGPPAAGLNQAGSGRAGTSRVNPVGGVIGEGRPATGSGRGLTGQPAAERPSGIYGQGGGRGSGRRETGEETHWDPDNPWETAEGVSPVVLPTPEQRVDPGPAIGLN